MARKIASVAARAPAWFADESRYMEAEALRTTGNHGWSSTSPFCNPHWLIHG